MKSHQHTNIGRHILNMRHLPQQSRQNGKDKAKPDRIESDSGEDDNESFVHNAFRLQHFQQKCDAVL
ncbi:hypothetical protein GOZ96_18175 [Agrobacterium vitis]|uniref:hypothetical protein n=1 Tax=Agrobacterium vitis TaxID=373 RepID=UPI0012E90B6C|nr:hypothetical protein [Agrobacterium vitis]MVA31209.1 hypothetical protein [Agrobacterium vitis]